MRYYVWLNEPPYTTISRGISLDLLAAFGPKAIERAKDRGHEEAWDYNGFTFQAFNDKEAA